MTLNKKNTYAIGSLLLMLVLVFSSCSTKKNTLTRRMYHNLTAHYNAYWNGRESLREGETELKKTAEDNYTFVLNVYNYGTKENALNLNPYMDRAIEKGKKVVQKHSMPFNNKEYVRWIDDSWLMVGQAHFYKQDYTMARRTFDYIIKQYNYNAIKYDAMIWLAKTYIQLKEYEKAQSLLDLVESKKDKDNISRDAKRALPMVYADMHIKKKDFSLSIPFLEDALYVNRNREILARLNFILGQIYQNTNDLETSTEYFLSSLKHRPSYEMSFNAKINLARSYDVTTGDSKLIIKKLNKMLKDLKNEEFRDQIYYALAEIALKDENDTLAINYLRKSVSTSTSNNYQKAVSALKLADLYFSYPDYRNSQAYYDSTIMFLPKEFPNYEEIEIKSYTLNDLVQNLVTVQTEDSLQSLAKMPEKERNKKIDEIIDELKKEEKRKRELELQKQKDLAFYQRNVNTRNMNNSSGSWYFYNPSTMSFGYTEFIKKWGNRKLEDLWRLSNKTPSFTFDDNIAAADSTESDSTKSLITDPMKREYYLQFLPLTDELVELSNEKIEEALYQLGYIYKEGLKDYPESITSFDELMKRFPETEHTLEVYYHLYKLYEETGNNSLKDHYSELIINNFPESDYAKIIQDPNYNLVLQAQKNKSKTLYKETWDAYNNEQYMMVKIYSDEAIQKYSEDMELLPKFLYLKALARGKTDGADSLKKDLLQIVSNYPQHSVTPSAQNLLDYMNAPPEAGSTGQGQTPSEEEKLAQELAESPYEYTPDILHFYIMVVNSKHINVSATKIKISDHNQKYHKLDNLSVSSVLLDNKRQMITVSSFPDASEASIYFKGVTNDDYVMSGLDTEYFQHFVISGEDYKVFYQNKNTELYMKFFENYYLKEK